MAVNRPWFEFKNMDSNSPELFIYDDIDDWFGVSAQSIIDQIRSLDVSDITVRINCRGGMVFEGIAIYNALRLHKANIHVSIEGLAASIASVIAMAGDTVTIAENAMIMIHNPYGWASGDAEEMRKTADVMDKITDSIAVSYIPRTDKSIEEVKVLMAEETWYTAAEALEAGLVDQVDSPIKAAAFFDLSQFTNAPEGFCQNKPPENQEQPPENQEQPQEKVSDALAIASLCNKSGYPEKIAAFLELELSESEVKAKLTGFDEIKNLCKAANNENKAKDFINSSKSVDDVRKELFNLLTVDDESINNSLLPNQQTSQTPVVIDTANIYSKRNRV